MKRVLAILAVLALISTPIFAEDLKKLSVDDASFASPWIQTDPTVKTEGKGSIKITTKWPTTVYLGEVTGLNIVSVRFIFFLSHNCVISCQKAQHQLVPITYTIKMKRANPLKRICLY